MNCVLKKLNCDFRIKKFRIKKIRIKIDATAKFCRLHNVYDWASE